MLDNYDYSAPFDITKVYTYTEDEFVVYLPKCYESYTAPDGGNEMRYQFGEFMQSEEYVIKGEFDYDSDSSDNDMLEEKQRDRKRLLRWIEKYTIKED